MCAWNGSSHYKSLSSSFVTAVCEVGECGCGCECGWVVVSGCVGHLGDDGEGESEMKEEGEGGRVSRRE